MDRETKKLLATGGLSAVVLSTATSIIVAWEGVRTRPYKDPVGVLTVCYGHTGKDIQKREYTRAECAALLKKDVDRHAAALQCIKTPLNEYHQAAFVSFAYNVGAGAFCGSTLVKKANAGDMKGACAELSRWTKAGGKTISGLVNRRAAERAICEKGLQND